MKVIKRFIIPWMYWNICWQLFFLILNAPWQVRIIPIFISVLVLGLIYLVLCGEEYLNQ